jgi:hypothetical protein
MYDIEARLGRALADRLAVPLSATLFSGRDLPSASRI